MKITNVRVTKLTGWLDAEWAGEERSAAPIDAYEAYAARSEPSPIDPARGKLPIRRYYTEIETDEGFTGLYGPIVYEEQADIIAKKLKPFLIGQDPLAIERLWDQMRFDRHGRNGYYMMALSAVDCALWDLRGKFYNTPVYRLLGGPVRDKLPAYASMLGHSLEPDASAIRAVEAVRAGFAAQKWFFRHGPASGESGKSRNLALARTIREAIGPEQTFMLDCWMGWDVPYALDMMDRLAELRPLWLEEPLSPDQTEGYRVLKERGALLLAAGEHLYTRRDFKPYLERGLLHYVQPDPDWTGGITELRKIAALAETFDVQFVPHGCTLIPNLHVAASLPPRLCPYVEYLIRYQKQQSHFHQYKYEPVNGWIPLPELPGLGIVLDESQIDHRELHE